MMTSRRVKIIVERRVVTKCVHLVVLQGPPETKHSSLGIHSSWDSLTTLFDAQRLSDMDELLTSSI